MKNIVACIVLVLLVTQPSTVVADGKIMVSSAIPGDVYLGGIKQGSITPGQTIILPVQEPGPYVVEVRGTNSKLVHREETSLDPSRNEERTVQAFSESPTPVSKSKEVAEVSPDPKGAVTREELNSAVNRGARQAKSETLAEEAARRKRVQQREMTNAAIIHVLAVEGRRLPPGVKGMERIKLLGELIPNIGKR